MSEDNIKIPDGYYRVDAGTFREGDLWYDYDDTNTFCPIQIDYHGAALVCGDIVARPMEGYMTCPPDPIGGYALVIVGEVCCGDWISINGEWEPSLEESWGQDVDDWAAVCRFIHASPKTDAAQRKATPVATGALDYFPDAIRAVAQCSWTGNEQHNPGSLLHWDRSKSGDEADALMRHFLERGTDDTDGVRHSAKVAWRALALLQKEIEGEQ